MKISNVVKMLGALAQASRLDLFRLLIKRGPKGYSAGEISHRLDISPPTLSFHLRALQQAGLVVGRREGRFIFYSADFKRMQKLVAYLTENCCALSDDDCSSSCELTSQELST